MVHTNLDRPMTDAPPTFITPTPQAPALRPWKERLAQTLGFEATGLVISLPFLSLFTTQDTAESIAVLVALTLAVMAWSPLHNTVFDTLDLRCSGRVASDRPQLWRVIHAISHEVSSILVSLPILMIGAGLDFQTALFIDLGLSVIYAAWAWAFFLIWDRWRPIPTPSINGEFP